MKFITNQKRNRHLTSKCRFERTCPVTILPQPGKNARPRTTLPDRLDQTRERAARVVIRVRGPVGKNPSETIKRWWRTVRDSNPRDGSPPTHFPGVRLRPLGQLSVPGDISNNRRDVQGGIGEKVAPMPSLSYQSLSGSGSPGSGPRSVRVSGSGAGVLRGGTSASGLRTQMSRWAKGISMPSARNRRMIS